MRSKACRIVQNILHKHAGSAELNRSEHDTVRFRERLLKDLALFVESRPVRRKHQSLVPVKTVIDFVQTKMQMYRVRTYRSYCGNGGREL